MNSAANSLFTAPFLFSYFPLTSFIFSILLRFFPFSFGFPSDLPPLISERYQCSAAGSRPPSPAPSPAALLSWHPHPVFVLCPTEGGDIEWEWQRQGDSVRQVGAVMGHDLIREA